MVYRILLLVLIVLLGLAIIGPEQRRPPSSGPEREDPAEGRLEKEVVADFEQGLDTWHTLQGPPVSRRAYRPRAGHVLEIPGGRENELILSREGEYDWFGWTAFSFDVHAPDSLRGREIYLAVRDDEHFWYQSRKPFELSGGWQTCLVDLVPTPADNGLVPAGHHRPWSGDVSHSLRTIQLRFQGSTPFSAPVMVDNLVLLRPPGGAVAPPLAVTGLRSNASEVGLYEKFEISFNLSRSYHNPYDPDEISVYGVFLLPGGRRVRMPGFFYQPYERRLTGGREELVPAGRGRWMVRFAPRETGYHRFFIEVVDREDRLESDTWNFLGVESASRGFARVSTRDSRYFEFDDGTFFYPVGMNLISPWDRPYNQDYVETPPIGLGTLAFDHYFERMQANGMNFCRMWMAYWWLALEWNPEEGPYHGLGRYSASNAWRLDHVLEQAEERGVYILLTLNNHTMMSSVSWGRNPFNRAAGGLISNPGEYFTDTRARELVKRRFRYIVARWGYSTAVFAWDLWSEVDLTMNYNMANVRQWHSDMGDFLKEKDPFRRMVTTHYCYPSRAVEWGQLPESFAFLHSNSYVEVDRLPDNQLEAIREYWQRMKVLGRPVFSSEFGGHWALSEDEVLLRDLHTGLWSTFMTPMAGTPQFWWWNFVDDKDLYHLYRALSRFAAGEDRRGLDWSEIEASIGNDPSGFLSVIALGGPDGAWAWVYHFLSALKSGHEERLVRGAEMILPGLRDGRYLVEFWDTRKGEVFQSLTLESRDGAMAVPLPPVATDFACKVRKARGN